MSGRYLTDLADVLRAAGVTVIEHDGWQDRARSSGGYADGRPWCVMWHHTASSTSPGNDAAYCATGDDDAPVCNLIVNRDGSVTVIAAGATNTNGKGYALAFSRGIVPDDSMNTHAVGMEIANNGVGEPYPVAQIDAAFAASVAICAAYGLDPADVASHHDWAPDRKIDPATSEAVAGAWSPAPVNTSGSWSLVDLRDECARRAGSSPTPTPPTPTPEDDDMTLIVANDSTWTVWSGNGLERRAYGTMDEFNAAVMLGNAGAVRLVNVSGQPVRSIGDVGEPVSPAVLEALGRAV